MYTAVIVVNSATPQTLVDGVHDAIGLQLMVNRNEQVPEVRLMECYATNVAEMFKADFVHL